MGGSGVLTHPKNEFVKACLSFSELFPGKARDNRVLAGVASVLPECIERTVSVGFQRMVVCADHGEKAGALEAEI